MFLKFCVCICLHCSNLHLVFRNEKGELTIRTTKLGLLASYTIQKVCFLTTNYGHKEFSELQIGKFIFWSQKSSWSFAELHGRFLFSKPQLMAICRRRATIKTFFSDNAGFSDLLSKASGSKYIQLCKNHTQFKSIRRISDCVHALMM